MFNDFKGFNAENNPVKISVPPTLLASSIGIVDDSTTCISMDLKMDGDLVYLIGGTRAELGASEYGRMIAEKNGTNAIGGNVPTLPDTRTAWNSYEGLGRAIQQRLIASAHPLEYGGLGVGLAKKCIAGQKGMRVDVSVIPLNAHETLFSESLGRILVSVAPQNKQAFEKIMGVHAQRVGVVEGTALSIEKNGQTLVHARVQELDSAYKKTFEGF